MKTTKSIYDRFIRDLDNHHAQVYREIERVNEAKKRANEAFFVLRGEFNAEDEIESSRKETRRAMRRARYNGEIVCNLDD